MRIGHGCRYAVANSFGHLVEGRDFRIGLFFDCPGHAAPSSRPAITCVKDCTAHLSTARAAMLGSESVLKLSLTDQ
jgi:hypothetical protein